MDRGITRRALLGASMAAPLLASACATPESLVAEDSGVTLEQGDLTSRHWPGQQVHWVLARPAGGASPRVVVALHGRGGSADGAFTGLHLDRHVGSTGLAVAAIDGGDTYWHARRSGVDAGAMVVEDFLPLLARHGLRTDRIGLLGWSMGGYGALWLATQLGPHRVGGVAAESAALWLSPGDSAPGAFDGRADFVAHDVFRLRKRLHGIPVRLDCGLQDPFITANRTFAQGLDDVTTRFTAGGHTDGYWSSNGAAQMSWLSTHLAGGPRRSHDRTAGASARPTLHDEPARGHS